MEEVFEAEIMPDSAGNTLNITLATTFAVAVIFLFLGISIGTIVELKSVEVEETQNWWEVPVHDRHKMNSLNLTGERSAIPINGSYKVLLYTEHYIEVELPLSEEDAGFPEDDVMHVALWLPDVEDGKKIPP